MADQARRFASLLYVSAWEGKNPSPGAGLNWRPADQVSQVFDCGLNLCTACESAQLLDEADSVEARCSLQYNTG